MGPLAGTFHTLLQGPDRVEVFIHLPLVFFSETVFEAAAVFEHEVEDAGVPFQPSPDLLNPFTRVGVEQSVEDFLGLVQRRNWAPRASV